MIAKTVNEKQYRSAHDRFLKRVIVNFLVYELRYLGPVTAGGVADELIRMFGENVPQEDRLKHGQMLWNAPDKNAVDGPEGETCKPVTLSVVTGEDVSLFERGKSIGTIRKQIAGRIMREAERQGTRLSAGDAGLILAKYEPEIFPAEIKRCKRETAGGS